MNGKHQQSNSIKQSSTRVISSTIANGSGVLLRVIFKMATLAIAGRLWSDSLLADYLVLFSLARLMLSADIGIGTYGSNILCRLAAKGDSLEYKQKMTEFASLIIAIFVSGFVILFMIIGFTDISNILSLSQLDVEKASWAFGILSVAYLFNSTIAGFMMLVYRSFLEISRAQWILNVRYIVQIIFFVSFAFFINPIIWIAASELFIMIAFGTWLLSDLQTRHRNEISFPSLDGLKKGFSHIMPSLILFGGQGAGAILKNGVIAIGSAHHGSNMMSGFIITLSLYSLAFSVISLTSQGLAQEFARGNKDSNNDRIKFVSRVASKHIIGLSALGSVIIAIVGENIIAVWMGQVPNSLNKLILITQAIYIMFAGINYVPRLYLISQNSLKPIALSGILQVVIGLIVSFLLIPKGPIGAVLGLLAGEVVSVLFIYFWMIIIRDEWKLNRFAFMGSRAIVALISWGFVWIVSTRFLDVSNNYILIGLSGIFSLLTWWFIICDRAERVYLINMSKEVVKGYSLFDIKWN